MLRWSKLFFGDSRKDHPDIDNVIEKIGIEKANLNTKLHINMKHERRKFTNECKGEVALEAIKVSLTIVELAQKYNVNFV